MSNLDMEWELERQLQNLRNRTDVLVAIADVLAVGIDSLFLVIIGIIILNMQTGFAFLEAGSVRNETL
jgi:hypothetical protein